VYYPEKIEDGKVIPAHTGPGETTVPGSLLTSIELSIDIEPQKFSYPSGHLTLNAGKPFEILPESNLENLLVEVVGGTGTLPDWLSIDESTGKIEANPPMTAGGKQGPFTLTVYDGSTVLKSLDLEIKVKLPPLKIGWGPSEGETELPVIVGEEVDLPIIIEDGDDGGVKLTVSRKEVLGLEWDPTSRSFTGKVDKRGPIWITVNAERKVDGYTASRKFLIYGEKDSQT